MSVPIHADSVREALAPMLGARFVNTTPLCGDAADCLRLYAPSCMTLGTMYDRVKDVIFGDLYDALGQGMVLTLENGIRLRLRLKDVDTLADAALGVLMDALDPSALTPESLREYAFQTGSLSALRVLLLRYGDQLPEMEKTMLIRIIKENHPADRYSDWLK